MHTRAGTSQWFKDFMPCCCSVWDVCGLQCLGFSWQASPCCRSVWDSHLCQICPAAAVYGTYVVASFTPRVCFEAHHSVAAIKIVVGCSWAIVLLNW